MTLFSCRNIYSSSLPRLAVNRFLFRQSLQRFNIVAPAFVFTPHAAVREVACRARRSLYVLLYLLTAQLSEIIVHAV
jgi:hypothetical protein